MEDKKEVSFDDLTPLKYANVGDRREYYHREVLKQSCENITDDPNAKVSPETGFITVSYHPRDHDICSQYEKQSTIYELPLSPSIITLTKCQETGRDIVKKSMLKDKLMSDDMVKAAENEC